MSVVGPVFRTLLIVAYVLPLVLVTEPTRTNTLGLAT
jgi:hypothetical protein